MWAVFITFISLLCIRKRRILFMDVIKHGKTISFDVLIRKKVDSMEEILISNAQISYKLGLAELNDTISTGSMTKEINISYFIHPEWCIISVPPIY